jgi:hypothetical protein
MACDFCGGDHQGYGWHEFEGTKMVFRPAPPATDPLPVDWFYMGMSCGQTPAGVKCRAVEEFNMACAPCRDAHIKATSCECDWSYAECPDCKLIFGN